MSSTSAYFTSLSVYAVLLLLLVSCQGWSLERTYGEVCSISGEWLNLTEVHSAGGSLLSQFYTVPQCLGACRDLLDNCVGVDVDSRLHDEIRCWVHTNATDFDETYHAIGLIQYRLRSSCAQPVCDVTGARWRFHANSNSFHGEIPPKPVGSRWLKLWSLDECLEVCAGDLRCLAVDFNMDSRTCYVHRNPHFADTRGPYLQVHQFVVSQRCRPGDPITIKRTTPTTITRKPKTTPTHSSTSETTTTTTTTTTTRPTTTSTTTPTTSISSSTATPASIIKPTKRYTPSKSTRRFTPPTTTVTTTTTTRVTPTAATTKPALVRTTPRTTVSSHARGCETGWVIHAHTHSPGAVRYIGQLSIHDCLEHCNALTGSLLIGACLAVDVEFVDVNSSSSVVCWIHTDLARLSKKYRHPRVIQHVIVRCPQQQEAYSCFQEKDGVAAGHDQTCRHTCLPVWLRYPRQLSVTSATESEASSACLERCLRTGECIGVDVTPDDDSDDDGDDKCRYHNSHQAMTTLPRHSTRYLLLDRCYTGCSTSWTRQNHRRYRLQHFVRQNNSSASLCAATCRLQPNCSVYELAKSGDRVTCTFAAYYDETSFDVEPLVTSFTRKEHDCRLRAYRCEPSWLLQRNTRPVHDDGRRNCSTQVSTVSACLEACLMTSPRCAGATTTPVVDDVVECRLYANENQLRPTRDVTGTDLYVLHSHCYSHGRARNMQGPARIVLRKDQQQISTEDGSLITHRYTPSPTSTAFPLSSSSSSSAGVVRSTRPTPAASQTSTKSSRNTPFVATTNDFKDIY